MVSIIMPFRDAGLYIEECVQSILQQSYSNWELIAVNDHSTDDSKPILEAFQHQDSRIHVLQNKGLGIIDALMTGYALAQGSFITRMDADDVMPKDKISTLVDLLQYHGRGHIATGHVKYISEGVLGDGFKKYEQWLNNLCRTNSHFLDIYKECVIPSPCWMMYRQDFNSIGDFQSQQYPEDYDLVFRMYKGKMKVASSDKILHLWRDHMVRASRTDPNYLDNRFLKLKVDYFVELDWNADKQLILWGAGSKGKNIAKLLLGKSIPFTWVTNNEKKVGKHIYNNLIERDSKVLNIEENKDIILAVANEEEQVDIMKKLRLSSYPYSLKKFC